GGGSGRAHDDDDGEARAVGDGAGADARSHSFACAAREERTVVPVAERVVVGEPTARRAPGLAREHRRRPGELSVKKRALAVALTFVAGLVAAGARAEPSTTTVAAEELFRAGRELLAQRRYNEACETLDASAKV